jgi:hypothetical protein
VCRKSWKRRQGKGTGSVLVFSASALALLFAASMIRQNDRRGPQTWTELRRAGYDRDTALHAAELAVETGKYRIRIGPILIEGEEGPDV